MKNKQITNTIFIISLLLLNVSIYSLSNYYSISLKLGLTVFSIVASYFIIGEFTYYIVENGEAIILKNRFFPWINIKINSNSQGVEILNKKRKMLILKKGRSKETRYALSEMSSEDISVIEEKIKINE